MASSQKLENISLTLFIDNEKNKVLYAEAGVDFMNILLGFYFLPLGNVSRLVSKGSGVQPCGFNCISSLQQSVENLDPKYFSNDWNDGKFLTQISSMYGPLVDDLDDAEFLLCYTGCRLPKFWIVCDDLTVMCSDINTTMRILQNFGTDYVPKRLTVNMSETLVLDLLKLMLWSETPLSDLFLRKKVQVQNHQTQPQSKLMTGQLVDKGAYNLSLKVVISKSKNKILLGEAQGRFTDQLLGFLTIPLGLVSHLGFSGLGSFDNLYESLKKDNGYLLLNLVGRNLSNPFMSFIEGKRSSYMTYGLEEAIKMMVADDLSLQIFSCSAATALLRESKVEEHDLEVWRILKAALLSKSALTEGLRPFL